MSKKNLSKEKIIDATFDLLAKTHDLKKLSMRKLAASLDVQAPAIYWYFKNKQELLQALSETISEAIPYPSSQHSWQEQATELGLVMFDVYQKFPCAPEIMMATIPYSVTRMKRLEYFSALLFQSGFSFDETFDGVIAFNHYVMGATVNLMEERRLRSELFHQDEQVKAIKEQFDTLFATNDFPYITKGYNRRSEISSKSAFMSGIQLLIAGMEHQLKNKQQP